MRKWLIEKLGGVPKECYDEVEQERIGLSLELTRKTRAGIIKEGTLEILENVNKKLESENEKFKKLNKKMEGMINRKGIKWL